MAFVPSSPRSKPAARRRPTRSTGAHSEPPGKARHPSPSVRNLGSGWGRAVARPVDATQGYLPGLDGVRAVAVLAVVAYHLDLGWAPGGFLGVDIFFVLSGYLITGLLGAEWDRRGRLDLRRFWIRRARRLLPALAAMVAAVCAAATVVDRGHMLALRADVAAAATYTSNWWQIAADHSYFARFSPPSVLQHLWSLAVEEQFYLVWPLLLALGLRYLPRRSLAPTIAGAAACSAVAMAVLYDPGADPSRVYFGTDTHSSGLLLGAALAVSLPPERMAGWLAGQPRVRIRGLLDAAAALFAVAVAAGIVGLHQLDPATYRGGLGLITVATAGLDAVAACPATRTARILGVRPLRWIGVRSYARYLWHWPVLVLSREVLGPTAAAGTPVRLGMLALVVRLAGGSWTVIENPIRTRGLTACLRRPAEGSRRTGRARAGRRVCVAGLATLTAGMLVVGIAGLVVAPTPQDSRAEINADIRAVATPSPTTEGSPDVAAATSTPTGISAPAGSLLGTQITAIGDSVMLASATALQARLPGITIDAAISRQMAEAAHIIAG